MLRNAEAKKPECKDIIYIIHEMLRNEEAKNNRMLRNNLQTDYGNYMS